MAKKRKKTKKKVAKKASRKTKKASRQRVKAKRAKSKLKAKKKSVSIHGVKPSQIVGTVTHYFPKVNAAVVKLRKPLAVGDTIELRGATTSFQQKVESVQIDHVPIQNAKPGDEIGLQVKDRVREHDVIVFPS